MKTHTTKTNQNQEGEMNKKKHKQRMKKNMKRKKKDTYKNKVWGVFFHEIKAFTRGRAISHEIINKNTIFGTRIVRNLAFFVVQTRGVAGFGPKM